MSKYDGTVFPGAPNNAHAYALEMIGPGRRVLELGCAAGAFTKALADRGCDVVGVERDPTAAQAARRWAQRVICADLDSEAAWEGIERAGFDVVVFGDVLEHLRDPARALQASVRCLRPGGWVVASIPNVAHGDVRMALLGGSFPYRATGLLDSSHLRFFTHRSIAQLLDGAGLEILETATVTVPLFRTELGVEPRLVPPGVVEALSDDPDSCVYQYVVKAALQGAAPARAAPPVPEAPATRVGPPACTATPADMYIDLLKGCLTRAIFMGRDDAAREARELGRDWPADAETMVGLARLDNIQACVEAVIADGVPGDLIETGVWRGGSVIFMRALLAALGDTDRTVWVADSFAGLPAADRAASPETSGDLSRYRELAVSMEEVRANFSRYGLLDDRVRFIPGWFSDTLASAPVERLAVLRLDGDYYQSTMEALDALYPRVSPGGFVIVDDYGSLESAARAVDDYREAHGIDDEIVPIDWTGVFWRRRR